MHVDQIPCPNHPNEFLTNFCFHCNIIIKIEGCNIALCATCICRHT